MAVSETLRTIAFIIMAVVNSPWIQLPWITYMMMTINSICGGLSNPASYAMLIDISTPAQRKLLFSIRYWVINFSFVVGGIIGAFFFKTHFFELLLVLCCGAAFTTILIVFFIDESYVPSIEKQKERFSLIYIFKGYQEVIRDRLFILFILASTLVFSLERQLTGYIGIRLSQEMESQQFLFWRIDGVEMLGILRTENTILVVLTGFLVVKIIQKFSDGKVLLTGVALFISGYTTLCFSNNIWILLFMMLVLTIGEVTKAPIEQSYQAALPPEHARSSYVALGSLTYHVSSIIASLTVTMGAFFSSYVITGIVFVVGMTGAIIFYFILPQLEERKKSHDTLMKNKGA